jgi:hypothetical protein
MYYKNLILFQGDKHIWCTVHTPHLLPVHVMDHGEADEYYATHIGTGELGVCQANIGTRELGVCQANIGTRELGVCQTHIGTRELGVCQAHIGRRHTHTHMCAHTCTHKYAHTYTRAHTHERAQLMN